MGTSLQELEDKYVRVGDRNGKWRLGVFVCCIGGRRVRYKVKEEWVSLESNCMASYKFGKVV